MSKVISYIRFSTPAQREGTSLQRQTEAARLYAASIGAEFDDSLSYVDAGVSGYKGEHVRIGRLGEFLDLVKAGAVETGSTLVIEALDRLSRQETRTARDLFESILDAGVSIYTTIDRHLYEPDKYDLIEMITTLVRIDTAHRQSADKADRVRKAWAIRRETARETGRIVTSRAPAWLKIVDDRFEAIPERVKLLRELFGRAARGHSLTRIAVEWNDNRVPTWGRGKGGKRSLWRPDVLRKYVTGRAVLGEFVCHTLVGKRRVPTGEIIPDYYPQVIDPETWQAAQDAGALKRGLHTKDNEPLRNIFARVCRCAVCGGSVGMRAAGRPPKMSRYLVCRNTRAGGRTCGLTLKEATIKLDVAEDALLRSAPALPIRGHGDESLVDDIVAAQAALDSQDDKIDALIALAGSADLSIVRKRLQEAERVRDVLTADLEDAVAAAKDSAGPLVRHRLTTLRDALATDPLDRNAANLALRAACSRAVLDFVYGYLTLEWRHGGEHKIDLWPGRVFEVDP